MLKQCDHLWIAKKISFVISILAIMLFLIYKSDSLRVLSYVSIPNASLQFLKENDKFTSNYEITITLKNDDNELVW